MSKTLMHWLKRRKKKSQKFEKISDENEMPKAFCFFALFYQTSDIWSDINIRYMSKIFPTGVIIAGRFGIMY